jgi:hypothetical protein
MKYPPEQFWEFAGDGGLFLLWIDIWGFLDLFLFKK